MLRASSEISLAVIETELLPSETSMNCRIVPFYVLHLVHEFELHKNIAHPRRTPTSLPCAKPNLIACTCDYPLPNDPDSHWPTRFMNALLPHCAVRLADGLHDLEVLG